MNDNNSELLKALHECAIACDNCLDSCLGEEHVKNMTECIRLDRDCSKICHLTAGFIASNSKFANGLVRLCEEICRSCAEECGKHDMKHCQDCAEACRRCAEACSKLP